MSKGFVQIRRGLEQHLISGSIGLFEVGAYLVMHLQADFETGIWTGSAPRLQATAPRGASLRDVQRAIERLSEIKFVRVFHVQGQRGNYRVLIHKYEPQFGALKGKRLNAFASESWCNPVYEVCAEAVTENGAESDAETVAEDAPYPKEEENREERKQTHRQKRAPGDPRFQPFFQLAYESYTSKHNRQKPLWGGKDRNKLKNLLKDQSAESLSLDRLKTLWRNFLNSTDSFTVKQGDSLAYFCESAGKFAEGPILAAPGKGANGKPTLTEIAGNNDRGLGLGLSAN
jgi:hypothetical protein